MSRSISLPPSITEFLATMPETSMGSQKVDIILRDGRVIPSVSIYNGEEAITTSTFNPRVIEAFRDMNGKIWNVPGR